MYTSPNGCSSCGAINSLRNVYHPLFDKNRVDIVLQAHVHNYQRTYPLIYDSDGTPTRTSTNPSAYTDPPGEIFATVGTGGVNIHSLGSPSYFVAKQQAKKYGALDISMTDDGSKLTGKYYRNGESTPYDTFTITKPVSISSLKFLTTNNVNFTNQTNPQNIGGQLSGNQTSDNNQTADKTQPDVIKNRKSIIFPDLSQILNRSKSSENKVSNGANVQKGNNLVPVLPQIPKNTKVPENKLTNRDNTSSLSEPIVSREKQNTVKPEPKNIFPNAVAGKNQISIEGSQVVLDGSSSKDKDGKIQSYKWQQIGGPKVKLSNANDPDTVFISPAVTRDTILVFKLIVVDDKGSLDSAITAIKVINDENRSLISPNIVEYLILTLEIKSEKGM